MVCPLTHVTMVMSASYGYSSCSDPAATKTLRYYCDGKINCTISFTDTLFGSSVCPHSANYGSAVLRCVGKVPCKICFRMKINVHKINGQNLSCT